jgi:hypothetical protein
MTAHDEVLSSISRRYHHFADKEARGRSRLYEQCARAIATDPAILAFLATLPELPHVVWRAGIDLNPLDVTDADDVDWLRCLIWPGEPDRSERLDAAIAVARRGPPRIIRGDLVDDLAALAAQAPAQASLVVFHSAVLSYVSPARRREFAAAVGALNAIWLSNEAPGVLPELRNEPAPGADTDPFILARDDRTALALTDGHGTWIEWISS